MTTTIHLHSTAEDDEVRAVLDLMMMGQRDLILSGFDAYLHANKLDMDAPDEPDWEQKYNDLRNAVRELAEYWAAAPQKFRQKAAAELLELL